MLSNLAQMMNQKYSAIDKTSTILIAKKQRGIAKCVPQIHLSNLWP